MASKVVASLVASLLYESKALSGLTAPSHVAYLAIAGNSGLADPGTHGRVTLGRRRVKALSSLKKVSGTLSVSYGDALASAEYGVERKVRGPIRAVHVATTQGRRRSNEDAALTASVKLASGESAVNMVVAVVADGAGGLGAGDRASTAAVSGFFSGVIESALLGASNAEYVVEYALARANEAVLSAAEDARRRIATTLTGGLALGESLVIAHVGDSRAYVILGGQARRLTVDHKARPGSHVITRALGPGLDSKGDIVKTPLPPGSTLLLCTDGVTDLLRDEEIGAIAVKHKTPSALAEAVLSLVEARGAPDNATLCLFMNWVEI